MSNDPKKPNPPDKKNGGDKQPRTIMTMILVALIFTVFINAIYNSISTANLDEITYTEFRSLLDDGKIDSVEFQSDRILILTKEDAEKPTMEQKIYYTGLIPNMDTGTLTEELVDRGVDASGQIIEEVSPILGFILSWVLPIAIMYLLFSLLMRSMSKRMGGGLGGIG